MIMKKKIYQPPQVKCFTFDAEDLLAASFIGGNIGEEGEADTQKRRPAYGSENWTNENANPLKTSSWE